MENGHTPKTPDPSLLMPNELDSPLTPLGRQVLASHAGGQGESSDWAEFQRHWRGPAWIWLALLAVPLLLIDLAFGPITSLEMVVNSPFWRQLVFPVMAGFVGIVAVQATMLFLYVAFSPDPWWLRLAIVVPLAVAFVGAGLLGMAAVFWYREWAIDDDSLENSVRIFCALPLVTMGGIVPLVFFRWLFGWAMVRTEQKAIAAETPHVHRPASILNMLLLTAAIAGGFGLIRLAPTSTLSEPGSLWIVTGVMAMVAGGFSLLGIMPLVAICHFARPLVLRCAIVMAVLLVAVGVSLAAEACLVPWNQFQNRALFNAGMNATIGATFIGGLALYLWLLYLAGWVIRPAARWQSH